MKKLYYICLIMIIHVQSVSAQDNSRIKTFFLPANKHKVDISTGINPISKPVKLISVIDQSSETFNRELEVWHAFLRSVDLEHIGFVFLVRPIVDIDSFKKFWFVDMQMNYPFFYDQSNELFISNSITKVNSGHTMVLDQNHSVIVEGGSIVNTDRFNLYRSTLHNLTTEMGIKKAVRGEITEVKNGVVKSFYNSDPVYVTEDGEVLPTKLAKEYIISRKFIMQTSPLTDTVRLVKTNRK
ncbi:hypothetical protein [Lunatimonas salinarum]|uniref:hypothetical protein n=1 Tax=Lunatimonas salinarum TaxID=1774590 RepID=UPI001ADF28DD|nr:hypothetical protein [Lunatimonas salinarum]